MTNTPLRDKLVQIEHDVFDAAWLAGTARLALYPELVEALRALEEHLRLLRGIYQYTQLGDDDISRQLGAEAQAVLAKAEALKGE